MLFLPFLPFGYCPLSFSMPGAVAMGVCSGKNQAAMSMWYICGTYVVHTVCGTYVVPMWHICGTGIKTSGENTLAPSNFVHLVHGVQSGWKMKIDGLVSLSKGWFQDNPCHSVFYSAYIVLKCVCCMQSCGQEIAVVAKRPGRPDAPQLGATAVQLKNVKTTESTVIFFLTCDHQFAKTKF